MAKVVTPYNDQDRTKKEQVEEMFDNIAPTYDFLNHFLSAGIDRRWRKKAVDSLAAIQPQNILDLATGTGDFAVEALRLKPAKVIGGDISDLMMNVGRQKARKLNVASVLEFQRVDSENMPFEDNKFDAITVGFGVRNFQDLERGLGEMLRVLRPGGRVAILEVSQAVCVEKFDALPQLGRFTLRDGTRTIAIGKVLRLGIPKADQAAYLKATGGGGAGGAAAGGGASSGGGKAK